MAKGKGGSIMECFGRLEDPRIGRCKRHQLLDIITIAICAVICGADSWVHAEMFGRSKEDWFLTFLDLPQGIPSHDTFGDVFSRLDPDRFQECFMEWSRPVAGLLPGEVVAIDGKTVRRSHDKRAGKGAIHLVSAWASPELAEGKHPYPGAGEDRGEVQRNHGHSPVAGVAGTERVHRNHRRHGMPEGDCSRDSGSAGRLSPGSQGESGAAVPGHPGRGFCRVLLRRQRTGQRAAQPAGTALLLQTHDASPVMVAKFGFRK